MRARKWIVYVSVVVAGFGAGACNSSSPTSPTDLPGGQTNTVSGATINGSVTGAITSASSLGFTTLDGPGLTVTVVGTNLSAQVDGTGSFVLTNVPPGDVQLRFSGPGTDAVLTFTGVSKGEEIRITVTVTGNNASVQHVMRQDAEKKVEVEGRVTSATCPSFIVNGMTITTNSETHFVQGTCASLANGVKVEVKGTRQADGSVLARQVKVDMPPEKDKDDFELSGEVTAASGCSSFTVNGIFITTNAATQFKFGVCGDIQVGAKVTVKGTKTNGVYVAERVEITRKKDKVEEVELYGVVTAGGCGSFTVKGVVVTTNSKTQFKNGACSDIKLGVEVEVKATRTNDGVAVATRVQFEKPKIEEVELSGVVTAGGCGSFTVKGKVTKGIVPSEESVTVTTTSTTEFKEGVCSDIKPGVEVEVKGTRANGTGPVTATRVSIEKDEDDGGKVKEVELYGKVTAGGCGSFTLSNAGVSSSFTVTVTTTSATEFKYGVCSDIKPGVKVEVKGTQLATIHGTDTVGSGPVTATRVKFYEY